jgi:hypothetical protein
MLDTRSNTSAVTFTRLRTSTRTSSCVCCSIDCSRHVRPVRRSLSFIVNTRRSGRLVFAVGFVRSIVNIIVRLIRSCRFRICSCSTVAMPNSSRRSMPNVGASRPPTYRCSPNNICTICIGIVKQSESVRHVFTLNITIRYLFIYNRDRVSNKFVFSSVKAPLP